MSILKCLSVISAYKKEFANWIEIAAYYYSSPLKVNKLNKLISITDNFLKVKSSKEETNSDKNINKDTQWEISLWSVTQPLDVPMCHQDRTVAGRAKGTKQPHKAWFVSFTLCVCVCVCVLHAHLLLESNSDFLNGGND